MISTSGVSDGRRYTFTVFSKTISSRAYNLDLLLELMPENVYFPCGATNYYVAIVKLNGALRAVRGDSGGAVEINSIGTVASVDDDVQTIA